MALDYKILAGMKTLERPSVRTGIEQGLQDMYKARLQGVMNQELAGDPTMQAYSAMDPVAALKMMRGTGDGRPMTEGQRKKYEMMQMKWDEKMANKAEADEVSNRIIELENQAVDVINSTPLVQLGGALSPIMKELYPARNLYQRRSGKPWQSSSTNLIDQKFKETKEGRAVSEDQRQDAKFAIDNDRQVIKSFVDRHRKTLSSLFNVEAALKWAKRAATGDPLAAKNFMAALSRAGSDEALSDSERDLLEFADVGNKIQALVDKYVVTGQQFSAATLQGAYNSAVQVMQESGASMNKMLQELKKKLGSSIGKNIIDTYIISTSVPSVGNFVNARQGQSGSGTGSNVNVNQSNTPRKAPPVRKSPNSWGKPPG